MKKSTIRDLTSNFIDLINNSKAEDYHTDPESLIHTKDQIHKVLEQVIVNGMTSFDATELKSLAQIVYYESKNNTKLQQAFDNIVSVLNYFLNIEE